MKRLLKYSVSPSTIWEPIENTGNWFKKQNCRSLGFIHSNLRHMVQRSKGVEFSTRNQNREGEGSGICTLVNSLGDKGSFWVLTHRGAKRPDVHP